MKKILMHITKPKNTCEESIYWITQENWANMMHVYDIIKLCKTQSIEDSENINVAKS